jgi:hypothetical protein
MTAAEFWPLLPARWLPPTGLAPAWRLRTTVIRGPLEPPVLVAPVGTPGRLGGQLAEACHKSVGRGGSCLAVLCSRRGLPANPTLQITHSDELARESQSAGLLFQVRLEGWLGEQLGAQQAESLFVATGRMAAVAEPPVERGSTRARSVSAIARRDVVNRMWLDHSACSPNAGWAGPPARPTRTLYAEGVPAAMRPTGQTTGPGDGADGDDGADAQQLAGGGDNGQPLPARSAGVVGAPRCPLPAQADCLLREHSPAG